MFFLARLNVGDRHVFRHHQLLLATFIFDGQGAAIGFGQGAHGAIGHGAGAAVGIFPAVVTFAAAFQARFKDRDFQRFERAVSLRNCRRTDKAVGLDRLQVCFGNQANAGLVSQLDTLMFTRTGGEVQRVGLNAVNRAAHWLDNLHVSGLRHDSSAKQQQAERGGKCSFHRYFLGR